MRRRTMSKLITTSIAVAVLVSYSSATSNNIRRRRVKQQNYKNRNNNKNVDNYLVGQGNQQLYSASQIDRGMQVAEGLDGDDFEDVSWADLPEQMKKAAQKLGYDAIIWDEGLTADTDLLYWGQLTQGQQKAAELFGYTEKDWDEDNSIAESKYIYSDNRERIKKAKTNSVPDVNGIMAQGEVRGNKMRNRGDDARQIAPNNRQRNKTTARGAGRGGNQAISAKGSNQVDQGITAKGANQVGAAKDATQGIAANGQGVRQGGAAKGGTKGANQSIVANGAYHSAAYQEGIVNGANQGIVGKGAAKGTNEGIIGYEGYQGETYQGIAQSSTAKGAKGTNQSISANGPNQDILANQAIVNEAQQGVGTKGGSLAMTARDRFGNVGNGERDKGAAANVAKGYQGSIMKGTNMAAKGGAQGIAANGRVKGQKGAQGQSIVANGYNGPPGIMGYDSNTLEGTYQSTFWSTQAPTDEPTYEPTVQPTDFPTKYPTQQPTIVPTTEPTENPTAVPPTPYPTRPMVGRGVGKPPMQQSESYNPTEFDWSQVDQYSWDQLPDYVRIAAIILGYDANIWNNNLTSPIDALDWSVLSTAQKNAAMLFGYDEQSWNFGKLN